MKIVLFLLVGMLAVQQESNNGAETHPLAKEKTKQVTELKRFNLWVAESTISFSGKGRVKIKNAFIRFMTNGEVWFHGIYDSNIHGRNFKNTFYLEDASGNMRYEITVDHFLECGSEARKYQIQPKNFKQYQAGHEVNWRQTGWTLSNRRNC